MSARSEVPGATQALSVLAQTTQGSATLCLILVGHAAGLGLGVASVAVAAYAGGAGVGRPVQARCIDRYGAARVLLFCGLLHELALVAVAISGMAKSPTGLIAAGLLLGLSLPPVSTWQRVHWPAHFATPVRAFARIALLQMVAILMGPVLYGGVAAASGSQDAATVIAGTVAAASTVALAIGQRRAVAPRADGSRGSLRAHIGPLFWGLSIGVTAGAISVIAPASAIRAGHPSLGAALVVAETSGGIVGGLVAGRVSDRASPRLLLIIGATVQIVGAAALVTRPPLIVAAIALLVEGLGLVPTISAVSAMTARRGDGSAEFFGWQSTAQGVGAAIGSALAGAVADVSALGGLRASAVVPLTCALATVITAQRAQPD